MSAELAKTFLRMARCYWSMAAKTESLAFERYCLQRYMRYDDAVKYLAARAAR